MTTRCAFQIEDPSRGPGRVDFRAPDEGFGFEGTPKPKIQRDTSPQKGNLIMWYAAVLLSSWWHGLGEASSAYVLRGRLCTMCSVEPDDPQIIT